MKLEAFVRSQAQANHLHQIGIKSVTKYSELEEVMTYAQESHSEYFLLIDDKHDQLYDIEHFIASSSEKSSSLIDYSRNDGRKLLYPHQGSFLEEKRPPESYYDGFREVGVFLLSKTILLEGIATNSFHVEKYIPCPTTSGNTKKPALFLDRDGVIIEDAHYLYQPEEAKIYPQIIPIIREANQAGWYVFVITNQSGVARGYFSETDVKDLHLFLDQELQNHGVYINHWYTCPFYPKGDNEFAKTSLLRKPAPGMVLKACQGLSVDLSQSFMIGDKESDIIEIDGLKTLLIQRSYPLDESQAPVFFDLKTIRDYLFR